MPAIMPMIAITIRSSMRVKPFSSRISPVLVGRLSIERLPLRGRVDVVDVLVAPGVRVRLVLIGAHPPLLRARHRVDRDAAQELDLLPERSVLLDAVHQCLEIRRITLRVDPGLLDDAGVAELLVQVDRLTHRPEGPPQVHLLLALHRELGDRHERPGHDRQDGDGHHQLDERDALLTFPAAYPHGRFPPPPYFEMFTVMPCLSNGSRCADGSSTEISVKLIVVVPGFLATNVRSMRTPSPLTPGLLPWRDRPTITSSFRAPRVARTNGRDPSCDRNGDVPPWVAKSTY